MAFDSFPGTTHASKALQLGLRDSEPESGGPFQGCWVPETRPIEAGSGTLQVTDTQDSAPAPPCHMASSCSPGAHLCSQNSPRALPHRPHVPGPLQAPRCSSSTDPFCLSLGFFMLGMPKPSHSSLLSPVVPCPARFSLQNHPDATSWTLLASLSN